MREASSDTRSALVYYEHNFIADHDKIHPRYMRECYIGTEERKVVKTQMMARKAQDLDERTSAQSTIKQPRQNLRGTFRIYH